MTRFERNGHWILLALTAVLAYVTVGFVAVSALALLAGVAGGASLGALLADAAIVVGLAALMVLADAALAVWFIVSVVRRASFPTSDRLATLFSLLETVLPPLRGLALSRRFEPDFDERRRALTARYVDGELSEREFEREMRELLESADPEAASVDHADPLDDRDSVERDRTRADDAPVPDALANERRRETERE